MASSLSGKVFAVTGAATGIGRATARLLASKGAKLSLCDVNSSELQKTVDSLSGDSSNYLTTEVDVSNSSQVNAWIEGTVSKFGPLSGAANIAGIGPRTKKLRDLTDNDWDLVSGVNAKGVFLSMRAQLPHMKNPASIVNCASVAGMGGAAGSAEYTSSKHSVVGLTKVAAREEGVNGIRVNAVAPGAVDTPLVAQMGKVLGMNPKTEFKLEDIQQRFAAPEEIASVIVFLLGEETGFVTGAVWAVDGGWSTH